MTVFTSCCGTLRESFGRAHCMTSRVRCTCVPLVWGSSKFLCDLMPIESSDSNMWNPGIVQLLLLKNIADGVDESRFSKNALQASQSRTVDIIWLLQLVNYAANLLFVKPMARVEIAYTCVIRSIKFVDCWWGANFGKGSVLAIVSTRLQQGFIATHLLGVSVPSFSRSACLQLRNNVRGVPEVMQRVGSQEFCSW